MYIYMFTYAACMHVHVSVIYDSFACNLLSGRYWVTSKKRRLNTSELFRLQGFPVKKIKSLRSKSKMGQLAGNAMCVPVVTHILNSIVPAVLAAK